MSIEAKMQNNILLAPYTTFKIGGPAKFFLEVKDKEDLMDAFVWASERNEAVFILGGGSNLLVADKGFDGLVIKIKADHIKVRSDRLDCGCGATLARANLISAGSGLSGLEWSTGIPGATMGGCLRGNAGAFGMSMADIVETVDVFNAKENRFEVFSNKDCQFRYRESIFKQNSDYLIWAVTLKMQRGNSEKIKDLMDDYSSKRRKSQPNLPSAGCVFKNLMFDDIKEKNEFLAKQIEEKGLAKGGKVPAGWVIDTVGLKGKIVGGSKVSLEHANFIVNTGKATADDVASLVKLIKKRVQEQLKIELEEEIQYLGF